MMGEKFISKKKSSEDDEQGEIFQFKLSHDEMETGEENFPDDIEDLKNQKNIIIVKPSRNFVMNFLRKIYYQLSDKEKRVRT